MRDVPSMTRFLGNSMHYANVFAVVACALACVSKHEEDSSVSPQSDSDSSSPSRLSDAFEMYCRKADANV